MSVNIEDALESVEDLPDMPARVKWARKRAGLSQDELAKAIGVTQAAVQKIEAGKGGTRFLTHLGRALQCDVNWLESGIGIQSLSPNPIYHVPLMSWDEMPDWKKILEQNKERKTIMLTDPEAQKGWYALPVVNDFMDGREAGKLSFGVGDTLIVDPNIEPENGDYCIAYYKGRALFRQYVIDGIKHFLCSLKAGIPIIEVDEAVKFGGVVIKVRRDINCKTRDFS